MLNLFKKNTPNKQSGPDIKGEQGRALIVSQYLNKIILESLDFEDVVQKISDAIPNELSFVTGVVAIIDNKKGTIRRVAASKTKEAYEAIRALKVPFKQIEIPLDDKENLMAEAVRSHQILITEDTWDVMKPILSKEESSKIQTIMGTNTTFVCPIYASHDKPIGVFLASTRKLKSELSQYEYDMIQIFTDNVGIAIEHALLFSELKVTSNKLAFANTRLQELDKLKDDFVSIASHELRTPMTAIKSFLWMALNKQKDNMSPDLKRYLDHAYVSTERLINLVNDMLNISRIEGGRIALRLSEVDIATFANDICEELAPKAAEKKISLKAVASKLPKVLCDADKIHEVLVNFIGNSLKFTDEGGKIWIDFKLEGEMITVNINDNGRGISAEDMSKLFTKFGRLANSYIKVAESTGTGLGLYITKSLVELHKGQVSAKSDGLDKGSTFSFSLPIVGSKAAESLVENAPKATTETKELEKTTINL